jgi:nucleoside-diphosphate-sugar epimerase
MNARHVVVGAGPVGLATARELAAQGHEVVLVSRSGTGAEVEGVTRAAADAADEAGLTRLAEGAAALYNCINPPSYDVWSTYWPPVAAAFLAAAETTGAVLVTASCLYGYGHVDEPMVEGMPDLAQGTKGRLRASMWADALAAHEAGRVRVTEARAGDFVGPQVPAGHSHLVRQLDTLRKGRRAWVIGDPDARRSWAYLPDVAATLAALGTDERALGRAWHVPSAPPRSQRQALTDLAAALSSPAHPARPVRVSRIPWSVLRGIGLVSPVMREIVDVRHQFDREYVIDASATTATFGLAPTPWDEVVAATAAAVPATA